MMLLVRRAHALEGHICHVFYRYVWVPRGLAYMFCPIVVREEGKKNSSVRLSRVRFVTYRVFRIV